MGKIGGFKEYVRIDENKIAVAERVSNYNEFTIPLPKDKIKEQGSNYLKKLKEENPEKLKEYRRTYYLEKKKQQNLTAEL